MMPDDEKSLWDAYGRSPSIEARNAIVMFYLPGVRRLAGRLCSQLPEGANLDFDEVVNEMLPGLFEVIPKFDLSRGLQFITFAAFRLRGRFLDALRERDWVPRKERLAQRDDPTHQIVDMITVDFSEGGDFADWPNATFANPLDQQVAEDEFWASVCRTLSMRRGAIVQMYYREGLTLSQAAERLGCPTHYISRELKAACEHLGCRTDFPELPAA